MSAVTWRVVGMLLLVLAVAAAGRRIYTRGFNAGQAQAEAAQLAATLEATREARATESRRNLNTQEAIHASTIRAQRARADADAARAELDGLRSDLAAGAAAASGESPAACAQRAAALSDVFGQCAARYRDLAERADRHADDARTLMDAWPR